MHSASQIGGQQQNIRQFQIMSLVPHPQVHVWLFYEEMVSWPASAELDTCIKLIVSGLFRPFLKQY